MMSGMGAVGQRARHDLIVGDGLASLLDDADEPLAFVLQDLDACAERQRIRLDLAKFDIL